VELLLLRRLPNFGPLTELMVNSPQLPPVGHRSQARLAQIFDSEAGSLSFELQTPSGLLHVRIEPPEPLGQPADRCQAGAMTLGVATAYPKLIPAD
jgi:hypothetical protein